MTTKARRWNKPVAGTGWNERIHTSVDGRFTITSVMMAAARNGCWKKEWKLEGCFKKPEFFGTLKEAKEVCFDDEAVDP